MIETNLRASRSFPFVSKTTGKDFISVATKVMTNNPLEVYDRRPLESPLLPSGFVGIKVQCFGYIYIRVGWGGGGLIFRLCC